MGGQWRHAARKREHARARAALYPTIEWGVTKCYRCTHPLEPGDLVELDHAADGSYGGFSHGRSPCRICGQRCNSKAGGEAGALANGKQLRERQCIICGLPYRASRGSDGSMAVTCGRTPCITAIKRIRKSHEEEPEAPPQTGRTW
jgi:hypothetical protein